jgi:hypothetical protein
LGVTTRASASAAAITAVKNAYLTRFHQQSVGTTIPPGVRCVLIAARCNQRASAAAECRAVRLVAA